MERFRVGSQLSSEEFQLVSLVMNFGNYAVPSIVHGHEELLKRNYYFFVSDSPVNRKFLEMGTSLVFHNITLTCLAKLTFHLHGCPRPLKIV